MTVTIIRLAGLQITQSTHLHRFTSYNQTRLAVLYRQNSIDMTRVLCQI
jgi:hypothetical protein